MLVEFCLPIHNEEKILKANILRLLNYCQSQNFNFSWKIVAIINGSIDNSLAIAHKLSLKHPEKIKVENIKQAGKGQALKKYFLKSSAGIVVYMDVDLAVSLNNIPDLLLLILNQGYNLVIGSRMLPDSHTKRSFLRELSSQGYNFLSKIILGHNFSDLQCGFKAMKIGLLQKLSPYIKDDKWFFDTELIALAKHFNFKIKEIPVDWSENRYDKRKSKINFMKDPIKFIINLIKLKARLLLLRKKGYKLAIQIIVIGIPLLNLV